LTGIGKVNFESTDIEANLKAILEELKVFGKANNLKGKLVERERERER
jgi:large subunit ribosomal protein L1